MSLPGLHMRLSNVGRFAEQSNLQCRDKSYAGRRLEALGKFSFSICREQLESTAEKFYLIPQPFELYCVIEA